MLNSLPLVLLLATSSVVVAGGLQPPPSYHPKPNEAGTIHWRACPELNDEIRNITGVPFTTSFECGTLSVPLDYTDYNAGRLNLSLVRVNATKGPAEGSVLINFGGPGDTGTEELGRFAPQLRDMIGQQWDLVSWDPRGTGRTLPFACSSAPQLALNTTTTPVSTPAFDNIDFPLPSVDLPTVFTNGGWDWAEVTASACYAQNKENGSLIGTAFTARDAMQVVDALGGDKQLRYYGFSYGTVLGSYLATMFPERVTRMDTDKTFLGMMSTCAANNCTLAHALNTTTADELLNAFAGTLRPLADAALASSDGFLRYLVVYTELFNILYTPRQWLAYTQNFVEQIKLNFTLPAVSSNLTVPPPYNLGPQAAFGISASDSISRAGSLEEYYPQVQFQNTVSSFSLAYYFTWLGPVWKSKAKEQYLGDFTASTRHPILYVNGAHDPVTPFRMAVQASRGFNGSVVLAHNGYGHTSLNDPSACVYGYTRDYFSNGALPKVGTVCEPDQSPRDLGKNWPYPA